MHVGSEICGCKCGQPTRRSQALLGLRLVVSRVRALPFHEVSSYHVHQEHIGTRTESTLHTHSYALLRAHKLVVFVIQFISGPTTLVTSSSAHMYVCISKLHVVV